MFGLYDVKVTGFQVMQGPVGLAYALRNVYDPDEIRPIKISIEEYEEHNDNNDCSN